MSYFKFLNREADLWGLNSQNTFDVFLIFIVSKKMNYVVTFELGWYASSDAVMIIARVFFFFFIKTNSTLFTASVI